VQFPYEASDFRQVSIRAPFSIAVGLLQISTTMELRSPRLPHVRANFGGTGSRVSGECKGTGTVDGAADYVFWRKNNLRSAGRAAAANICCEPSPNAVVCSQPASSQPGGASVGFINTRWMSPSLYYIAEFLILFAQSRISADSANPCALFIERNPVLGALGSPLN